MTASDPNKPEPSPIPKSPKVPAAQPDIADEAGPKTSEFATEKDAKEITEGEFDRVP
jgi:hypothetical protein